MATTFSPVHAFDLTIQKTHTWLDEIVGRGACDDREHAYKLLRLVLHTLRDCLPPDEACDLASQLPMLIRGFYFEGWKPSHGPAHPKTREQFIEVIRDEVGGTPSRKVLRTVEAIFEVIASHVTLGEIRDVVAVLPGDLRHLWPYATLA